jgi:hypothetical protein
MAADCLIKLLKKGILRVNLDILEVREGKTLYRVEVLQVDRVLVITR